MEKRSKAFRLTAWLAAGSILGAVFTSGWPARAQDAAMPPGGDPPARVGRLARLEGNVSMHGPDATQWTPAVLNFPFIAGDALWTEPQAQADIEFGPSVATLADRTELDLSNLDDQTLVASEPQGAIFLDLRNVRAGETYTVNTPRGAVQIAASGEYEILAGDADTATRVAVVRGAAQFTSGAVALRAEQGQLITATGDQPVSGDVEPLRSYDPFLTAMLARNSVPLDVPQAALGMTGADNLAQYGAWENTPDYGPVWYPQVGPDWVPYRDGSWSYVAPWGWTWVDDEPWGFAPFHYGRWAQHRHRWCWVPGERGAPVGAEPVYAPALVDFVLAGAIAGAAAGAIAASLHSGRGDIGWVPLGPREAYSPPYGASSRYLHRLNWGRGWHQPEWGGHGERTTVAHDTGHVFVNRDALTVAPAAAFVRSQQIRPVAHGLDSPAARGFQSVASPLRGPLPIHPVAETRGLTPHAAQQLGFAGRPAHPPAPGPEIRPGVPHLAIVPGGHRPVPTAVAPGPAIHPAPVAAGRPPVAAITPGPEIRHPAVTPQRPVAPQPPVHPASQALPPFRPGQPGTPGHSVPAAVPHPAMPHAPEPPAPRPAVMPHPVPMPTQRVEAPRPMEPHLAPPQPAFHAQPVRPMPPMTAPRPVMAQPHPVMMAPPRPMMAAPHFQAPRPMAAPPHAAPPPAAGHAPHP